MKFSTKTEYGLQAMINLARSPKRAKAAQIIAKEEGISVKYLERILNILTKDKLIVSTKGKSGGYVLARSTEQISVKDIVLALEGPIAPMKCIGKTCQKEAGCPIKTIWEVLGKDIEKNLEKINLKKLI